MSIALDLADLEGDGGFSIEQASALYRVPLTDYAKHDADTTRGRGLLLSSGCGMMMAAMDSCPALRWCTDVDTLRGKPGVRVGDFLLCAERRARPVAICGWFSISNPDELADAVRRLTRPAVVYLGNLRLGLPGEVDSFREFIDAIGAAS